MANHLITIISLGLLFTLAACQPSDSCTCKVEQKGMFGDCKTKDPETVWRKHYYTSVGLYGDCLPHVAEK